MQNQNAHLQEAISLTEKFIEENPNHPQVEEAKENIKVYQGIVNYWENEFGEGWLNV